MMKNETKVKVTGLDSGYSQRIASRAHTFTADEPLELGGTDRGPTPYELLLAALGACTAITVRMYAQRKDWSLEEVAVQVSMKKVHARDCEDCEQDTGFVDVFEKQVDLRGDLTNEQRQRLLDVADRCPVHQSLTSNAKIESVQTLSASEESTSGAC